MSDDNYERNLYSTRYFHFLRLIYWLKDAHSVSVILLTYLLRSMWFQTIWEYWALALISSTLILAEIKGINKNWKFDAVRCRNYMRDAWVLKFYHPFFIQSLKFSSTLEGVQFNSIWKCYCGICFSMPTSCAVLWCCCTEQHLNFNDRKIQASRIQTLLRVVDVERGTEWYSRPAAQQRQLLFARKLKWRADRIAYSQLQQRSSMSIWVFCIANAHARFANDEVVLL